MRRILGLVELLSWSESALRWGRDLRINWGRWLCSALVIGTDCNRRRTLHHHDCKYLFAQLKTIPTKTSSGLLRAGIQYVQIRSNGCKSHVCISCSKCSFFGWFYISEIGSDQGNWGARNLKSVHPDFLPAALECGARAICNLGEFWEPIQS